MEFTQAGIILFTQNFDACVAFYDKVLGLEKLYEIDREGERLTTFRLGNLYLMVETDGIARRSPKTVAQSPVKFRFNVPDVYSASAGLRAKGIAIDVVEHTWGVTAEFCDPDGNRCALRSDAGFGQ
ncbi:MAG: VOC family protein [Sulfitobacter sp.]